MKVPRGHGATEHLGTTHPGTRASPTMEEEISHTWLSIFIPLENGMMNRKMIGMVLYVLIKVAFFLDFSALEEYVFILFL